MSRTQSRFIDMSARYALPALLLACVLVAVASFALRAYAADQGQPTFEALDKDKDGVITASEARASPSVAARFADADKNQDGYLSRAEFNSIARP